MKASRTTEFARALLEMTDGASRETAETAVKDFARYLKDKGQLTHAPRIMAEYQRLYNTKHGIVEASVTLAARLGEPERKKLKEALIRKYGATDAVIDERVDQRLIGGMKIQVGDELHDTSLKHSLGQLQAQLLK